MKPYYESNGITIYHGDCREILPTLPKVDLVMTSPPYASQRDYGGQMDYDEWTTIVAGVADTPSNDGTQIIVNLGLIYRDGEIWQYWEPFVAGMRNEGWRLFGWYVWDKGFGSPGDWNGRLAPAHEWVFHFNRNAVTANKWVRTQQRKSSGTGLRTKDGTMSGVTSPDKCGQPYKVPDSVIRVYPNMKRGQIENEHPATYPIELPSHLISTFSAQGQTVLDPFMGSGTTLRAAKDLGRRAIGIEIEEKYCEIAAQRMAQEVLAI